MKINFITTKPYINSFNLQPRGSQSLVSNSIQYDTFEKSAISFESKRGCSESNFKVKNIKNLRCPVCSRIMLTEQQQKNFVEQVSSAKGEDLVEVLEFYEDERNLTQDWSSDKKISTFRPQRQEIVNIIKKSAIENPNLNIKQLVSLLAKPYLERLIKYQLAVIEELENYAFKNLESATEMLYLNSIVQIYKARIKGEVKPQFQRKEFINALSSVTLKRRVQKRITHIAQKLPTSTNDVSSFFVKYSSAKRGSKEIAQQLCRNSSPTTEHLHPKSRGGKNNTANYICDCAECNEKKGDILFSEWIKNLPDFEAGLQIYLQDVSNAIQRGELPESYYHYITEIITTIATLSNNKINLTPPSNITDTL